MVCPLAAHPPCCDTAPLGYVQVPVTFHPRDPGMYTQMWDVNLHLTSSCSRKIRLTFTAQVGQWGREQQCAEQVVKVSPPPPLPPGLSL